jgi:hypothetical protein
VSEQREWRKCEQRKDEREEEEEEEQEEGEEEESQTEEGSSLDPPRRRGRTMSEKEYEALKKEMKHTNERKRSRSPERSPQKCSQSDRDSGFSATFLLVMKIQPKEIVYDGTKRERILKLDAT